VALTIDRLPEQAAAACLVLAAIPEACDDGLFLDDGRLWLVRRYPPCVTEVEFDLLLKQQQAMVSLLAQRPPAPAVDKPAIGQWA
jgi:hypothetical protein